MADRAQDATILSPRLELSKNQKIGFLCLNFRDRALVGFAGASMVPSPFGRLKGVAGRVWV